MSENSEASRNVEKDNKSILRDAYARGDTFDTGEDKFISNEWTFQLKRLGRMYLWKKKK